jgi:hypothetical protein
MSGSKFDIIISSHRDEVYYLQKQHALGFVDPTRLRRGMMIGEHGNLALALETTSWAKE